MTTTIITIACFLAISEIIYFSVIKNRSRLTERTPTIWWIIGLGISQVFITAPLKMWHEVWWSTHQTMFNISVAFAIICIIAWLIVWIVQKW